MKKLPSKIDDEQLLKILEDKEPNEVVEKPSEHSVLQFLADLSIYPGTEEVPAKILYKLYKFHVPKPRASNTEFYLLLDGYLPRRENSQVFVKYLVNRNAADLTRILAEFLSKKRLNKKEVSRHFRTHFENFVQEYPIRSGNENIPATALFHIYNNWRKVNGISTKLNYPNFKAIISLYFKTKRTKNVNCVVKLDIQPLEKEIVAAIEWSTKFNEEKASKAHKAAKEKKNKS